MLQTWVSISESTICPQGFTRSSFAAVVMSLVVISIRYAWVLLNQYGRKGILVRNKLCKLLGSSETNVPFNHLHMKRFLDFAFCAPIGTHQCRCDRTRAETHVSFCSTSPTIQVVGSQCILSQVFEATQAVCGIINISLC